MATQDRYPTSDESIAGTWSVIPTSPTTKWDKVDETSPDDDTSYTYCTSNGRARFGFSAFSVPAGSTINYLRITYRHKKVSGGACNIRSCLKAGGTDYDTTDPGVNPTNGTWNTTTYDYSTNPKTGVAWTVDDVNGVGANALQAFGVYSNDSAPPPHCTQCFATVDYTPSATDRRGLVSWSELEAPNAPRRARLSWSEFEAPGAPRRAHLSWSELEVPIAPRRGRVSWSELELPIAPRRALASWAELEVPGQPRRGQVSWSELEVPPADRRGRLSWSEIEAPLAPRRGLASWSELQVPDSPRRGLVSWSELEVPLAPRRGLLSWSELEAPLAPRRGLASWAELDLGLAPRRARISWAELEVPPNTRRALVSWAELETTSPPPVLPLIVAGKRLHRLRNYE